MKKNYLNFDTLLADFVGHFVTYFNFYKRYFVVKLGNTESDNYQLLFIYDKNFPLDSIKKKVHHIYPTTKFVSLHDFNRDKHKSKFSDNYLCVFLFMSKVNSKEEAIKLNTAIEMVLKKFSFFQNYSIYNNTIVPGKKNKREFLEEINSSLSTYLSNTKIHFEEEKIIKKVCHEKFKNKQLPLVFYKTLKEGFSGAKVIEITPKGHVDFDRQRKYIVKYISKSIDQKEKALEKEYNNYKEYIEGGKGAAGTPTYAETSTHEGILYDYAISDESENSYPFSLVLSDKHENIFYNDRVEIVHELFTKNGLFVDWRQSIDKSPRKSFKEFYSDFFNTEDRIFDTIKTILNIDDQQLRAHPLYINYHHIISKKHSVYEKICHGDLHSENFFKDDYSVHLIDFGYTGKKHCVLDHTSLECSVKFKHFPLYLEMEEYIEIEEYLHSSSFFSDTKNKIKQFPRKRIRELLEVITAIRKNCYSEFLDEKNNRTKKCDFLEYEISLFLMTFRQIQYNDLNQRYALNSAIYLGKKIAAQLKIK